MAGFPDLMVCYKGFFVALEIKTLVGRATFQQLKVIEDIRMAGGWAWVVTSVDEVSKYLGVIDHALG